MTIPLLLELLDTPFLNRYGLAIAGSVLVLVCHLTGGFLATVVEFFLLLHLGDFAFRQVQFQLRRKSGEFILGGKVPADFTAETGPKHKRIVLITGAAMGLGKELAVKYRGYGYSLILWDINVAALEATKAELLAQTPKAGAPRGTVETAAVDVSDDAAVQSALTAVGDIDILILNAGVVIGKPIVDLQARDVSKVFGVNVFQLFNIARHAVPKMTSVNTTSEKRIVVISSIAGFRGFGKVADYNGSKAAATVFGQALTMELRHSGASNIGVSIVCPFVITTGMFQGLRSPSWAFKDLSTKQVVDAVVDAVVLRKYHVVIQWYLWWLNLVLNCLPASVAFYADIIMGGSKAMDTFHGKHGAKGASADSVAASTSGSS
jgi:all-trans-retinol dehydrogenase (NAD+)